MPARHAAREGADPAQERDLRRALRSSYRRARWSAEQRAERKLHALGVALYPSDALTLISRL
jgi:hypothetical protein